MTKTATAAQISESVTAHLEVYRANVEQSFGFLKSAQQADNDDQARIWAQRWTEARAILSAVESIVGAATDAANGR